MQSMVFVYFLPWKEKKLNRRLELNEFEMNKFELVIWSKCSVLVDYMSFFRTRGIFFILL